MPTETVYGLAADALDAAACTGIYQAMGRPPTDPLIVHVLSVRDAEKIAPLNPAARRLADAFWPGPLTLVLEKRAAVPDIVTAGLGSVAIRVPAHALFRRLLRATGRPLAAPSANPFGYVSPTTAEHVRAGLGERIGLILDGGPCAVGLESTIVDVRDPARRESAGDDAAVEIRLRAERALAVGVDAHLVGVLELRGGELRVDDAGGAPEAEKDGVGPAVDLRRLGVEPVGRNETEEVVSREIGAGDAAHALRSLRVDAGGLVAGRGCADVEVAEVAVDAARLGRGREEKQLVQVRGADVLHELRRDDLHGRRDLIDVHLQA
ncbi:MAG: L-threonylcarbamoyladenylate synthase [Opitutaceae bacterium]